MPCDAFRRQNRAIVLFPALVLKRNKSLIGADGIIKTEAGHLSAKMPFEIPTMSVRTQEARGELVNLRALFVQDSLYCP